MFSLLVEPSSLDFARWTPRPILLRMSQMKHPRPGRPTLTNLPPELVSLVLPYLTLHTIFQRLVHSSVYIRNVVLSTPIVLRVVLGGHFEADLRNSDRTYQKNQNLSTLTILEQYGPYGEIASIRVDTQNWWV